MAETSLNEAVLTFFDLVEPAPNSQTNEIGEIKKQLNQKNKQIDDLTKSINEMKKTTEKHLNEARKQCLSKTISIETKIMYVFLASFNPFKFREQRKIAWKLKVEMLRVQDDHFPREIVELDDNSDVMIKIEPET
jgi:hypothetical protein